jgi:hypothetical protein
LSLIKFSQIKRDVNWPTLWRREWHYYADVNSLIADTASPGELPAPIVGAYQQTVTVTEPSIVRVTAFGGYYKIDTDIEHVACYLELYDDTLAAQLAMGRCQVEYDTVRIRSATTGFVKEFTTSTSKQISLRVYASPTNEVNIRELSWSIDVCRA